MTDAHDEGTTWETLRRETEARLEAAGIDNAARESRWICERAGGDPMIRIADTPATVRSHHHWRLMVERREQREPLQYVLGRWPFRQLELFVDHRVLIPRPETEVVVEAALDAHARVGGIVVDLGTGSGAIALSIAAERPGTDVWAVDASAEAVAVARANLAGLGRKARTVRVVEGSWFEPIPSTIRGDVGVIVSNPPYVADGDELPADVEAWEPRSALRAGPDGLDDIRRIVAEAPAWLAPGGALVLEHAPDQAPTIRELARAAGFVEIHTGADLAGRDRFLVARR